MIPRRPSGATSSPALGGTSGEKRSTTIRRRRRFGWRYERVGVPMREAYICAALRTPVGKHGGALARVRADDLAAIPIPAVVERTRIDPPSTDHVSLRG